MESSGNKVAYGQHHIRCLPKQREALLQFKAAIVDHNGMLSSWTTPDCCQWEGIRCTNLTAHIISLHLSGQYNEYFSLGGYYAGSWRYISGEIHKSWNLLKGLTSNHFGLAMNSLEHLYLSGNVFKGEDLKSFMNICTLRSLYMSRNNMTEDLSSILYNFSSACVRYSLQELSLTHNQIRGSLPDLSAFSNLKKLDLFDNQLSGKISEGTRLPSHLEQLSIGSNSLEGGVPKSFGSSCTLKLLDLSDNKLSEDLTVIFNHLSGCSRYSLQELSLRNNQIKGTVSDLSVFSSLKILDLSDNQLSGKIPEGTRLPSHLEQLSVSFNSLEGGVPKSFGSICTLELLDLTLNKLSEDLTVIFNHLSGCSRYSLQHLDLSMNQISGTLPSNLATMFPSLKALFLHINKLNGTISEDLRFPAELEIRMIVRVSCSKDIKKTEERGTLEIDN
ncbi:uncharacterized protein HKW66_Vig0117850 [Vigna angularis]|uniref:Leucine-rich repeat-containing N-terminal plant-type domain-containing protein n=1 Tax=Phaseolus angularis TaxID=3914 RepID=A0A8T0JZI1_PHAAN|nr:uncharacterized protein HKW66_Vig0117850 [Vigna angularis]